MVFKKTFSGKEPDVPQAFAPSAGESELVSRIGVYGGDSGEFTDGNTKNVAWSGNSDLFSGVYDDRNILIHYIKVTNLDPSKTKEIHFWSNDEDDRDVDGQNYLFNIPMAKMGGSSTEASANDGRIDTVIDFPIPLLVMGGCRIGLVNVNSYSAFDYDAKVEICYTVLDGTPETASFDELKYKYLSAFSTFNASSSPEFAIQPDTTSTTWVEDIEIWGGMCMNYTNVASSAALATTYVKNADLDTVATISCVKGPTNTWDLTYPSGLSLNWPYGTWPSGTWPSATGTWALPSMALHWAEYRIAGVLILTYPDSISFDAGSMGSIDWGSVNWGSVHWGSFALTWSSAYKVSLGAAGSDTTVSFFPYPIYCAGNEAGASNMKVYTNAATVNYTRGTWFYRPVHAQGVDHGWV